VNRVEDDDNDDEDDADPKHNVKNLQKEYISKMKDLKNEYK
jgi:hypothetical protein